MMLHMTTNNQAAMIAASNMTSSFDNLYGNQDEIREMLDYKDSLDGPRTLLSKIEEAMGPITSVPSTTVWGHTYDDKTPFVKA